MENVRPHRISPMPVMPSTAGYCIARPSTPSEYVRIMYDAMSIYAGSLVKIRTKEPETVCARTNIRPQNATHSRMMPRNACAMRFVLPAP